MSEDFQSAVRNDGLFGVVFERDDETSYLYLLAMDRPQGQQIIANYNVTQRCRGQTELTVSWSRDGTLAGLFQQTELLAVFEVSPESGRRRAGREPNGQDVARFG